MGIIKSQLWLPSNELVTVDLDSEFYILPNFRVWEIANNKAEEEVKLVIPSKWAWLELKMLQITRDWHGRIDVNSYYRTPSYNALVGGDPKSCHLVGEAVDVACPGDEDLWINWWEHLCREFDQIGAIGLYSWGKHLEIGSDRRFGATKFQVRDNR